MVKKLTFIFAMVLLSVLFAACNGSSRPENGEQTRRYTSSDESTEAQRDTAYTAAPRASSIDEHNVGAVDRVDTTPVPPPMESAPMAPPAPAADSIMPPMAPAAGSITAPATGGSANLIAQNSIISPLSTEIVVEREVRLIKRGTLRMKTYEFDVADHFMRDIVFNVGGFIERSEINLITPVRAEQHRVASFTFRVPVDHFERIFTEIQSIGDVISASSTADDATATFYDTQSILESRRVEEERLLDIMGRAETVDELILLERRLSDIRADMLRLQSSLNSIDRLAAFSTISVFLTELIAEVEEDEYEEEDLEEYEEEQEYYVIEQKPAPPTLGQRMSESFMQSLRNIWNGISSVLVWFAGIIVPITIILVVLVTVILLIIIYIKKSKKRGIKHDKNI